MARSNAVPFDVRTATASDLVQLLGEERTTTVEIAQLYLRQIRSHDHNGTHLNTVINVVPEDQILETAACLDLERSEGKLRSPYHGIPFIVKVNSPQASAFLHPC